jgi:hypothetical protein
MALAEVGLVIDYFHGSTPEHLEKMGVDPTRLPGRGDWHARYVAEYRRPIRERSTLLVIWELEEGPVGFSTCEKILYGEQAHMHLHIVDPQLRGIGDRVRVAARDHRTLFQSAEVEAPVLRAQRF